MGLVLSLKAGQDFYVGDEQFVVSEVFSPTHFLLVHVRTGRAFEITDGKPTQILEGVGVYGAKRAPRVRVIVRARRHRSIRLARGQEVGPSDCGGP